ncbi:uncharacterized protein TNCV_2426011 [Trichonephila clavipes]|nr:uncharacterized protein TNCV_2426011 [Trichonephila clavipes]
MGDVTCTKNADMHYMYGRANDNGRAAQRMYHVQFPDRRMLPQRIFQRLHRQLREIRSFHVIRDDADQRRATLVVENQQISHPEEPELMVNAEFDAPKKPHTHQRNVRTKGKAEGRTENTVRKQKREVCEAKKGVKKLKLNSCRPKSIKSRPNSPVASISKDGVIKCTACEEEYCDPPAEEWTQCCKCQEWWYEECSKFKNGTFIGDYC